MLQQERGPRWIFVAAIFLFAVLFAELFFSVRQNSQTFDESAHLYAGYSYWKTHDFGINPEHPPLAKMWATLPLLQLRLAVNPPPPIYFRGASAVGGRTFLYAHDASALLLRVRLMMSAFTFALALLVFLAGREMFGWQAALIALLLLVFEPNVLANGALVTTDMAATAMLFGTVYTFYRYLKQPTLARLLVCSLFAGLTLSVKHSAVLMLPILPLLAVLHLAFGQDAGFSTPRTLVRRGSSLVGSLACIAAVSVTMLWACYGFRYAARPGNAPMTPPTAAFLETLEKPGEARFIGFFERHHLLPEAYLYGMTDIAVITDQGRPMYLFGRIYPEGRWFYFPSAFVIKSTLGFLLLLAVALGSRWLWSRELWRETLFMLTPPAVYLLFAMRSKLDLGLRHILPIYPFLIVLAAAGAWMLMRRSRGWAVACGALLVLHAASSLRAYPNYLPYSNEAWGGPSKTYKVLSDSNVGWSSGVTALQRYTTEHHITQCWFAYNGVADLSYFHLPCKPLPTFFSSALGSEQGVVPGMVKGPIFVSSENMTLSFAGPPELDSYRRFKDRTPDAVIAGEILVFDGTYDEPQISAQSHYAIARRAIRAHHPEQALPEAQQAEVLAPELLATHEMLTTLYAGANKKADAEREYQDALEIYQTRYGEFKKNVSPPEDPFPAEHSVVASATPPAK
ncbi:MAG: glycosyltransferase family 39 protein [Acidobacteriota bacterium]|nr:glycosyltransferase family 39 protein [Acidobacteriota bacterium]